MLFQKNRERGGGRKKRIKKEKQKGTAACSPPMELGNRDWTRASGGPRLRGGARGSNKQQVQSHLGGVEALLQQGPPVGPRRF